MLSCSGVYQPLRDCVQVDTICDLEEKNWTVVFGRIGTQ